MKKTLLWGAIASLFFASCSKNEITSSTIEPSGDFVATLNNQSRTELDGTSIVWNTEDELTIFTKTEHNRRYKVKELSNNGHTATFGYVGFTGASNGTISSNYAVYPYNAEATISGDVISTSIAAEQIYNADKINLSYALLVAKSQTTSFSFVNAGALMRFNISKSELIPDSYTLSSIKLSSVANNIAGNVTIDLGADSRSVVASTGTKEITLTAINQEITTEVQSFYIALPAGSFADKDLTITFTFTDGEKSFAIPAFELEQGSIKTIVYQINDTEDFEGTTPGDDFEGDTPGNKSYPANNEIWYQNGSTTVAITPGINQHSYKEINKFGDATIVSNTYNNTTGYWVIKFDKEVTEVSMNTFSYQNSLISVVLPNSITLIRASTFNRCPSLSEINIPEGVTEIGSCAFIGCSSLTSITLPASLKSLAGGNQFEKCTSLESVYCKPTTPPSPTDGGTFKKCSTNLKIYVPTASVSAYKASSAWSEYVDKFVGFDFE